MATCPKFRSTISHPPPYQENGRSGLKIYFSFLYYASYCTAVLEAADYLYLLTSRSYALSSLLYLTFSPSNPLPGVISRLFRMKRIMTNPRRFASVLPFALLGLFLVWYFKTTYLSPQATPALADSMTYNSKSTTIEFRPGTPKAPPYEYSRTLVVGKLSDEDISWIARELPGLNTSIYHVDAPPSELRIPKNKGHEAMVYLTHIIDPYDELADTTIFLHPHQTTWHNNDLLDSDAAKTIQHLSDAHVARVGYFNTRCHHEPGCPDWLRFDRPDEELDTYRKMEERYFTAQVWKELHPGISVPQAVSQPCCAQFAVSRDRVRQHPRSEYVRYRD
jgi:hypothetical protein